MMLALKYAPEFNQLARYLSEISKGNIGENELNNLAFLSEQAVVLAWVLGLAEKPMENKVTLGSNLVNVFENYNSIEDLIEKVILYLKMKLWNMLIIYQDWIYIVWNLQYQKKIHKC